MEITGNTQMLNQNLSEELRKEIFLFMVNSTNLGDKNEQKLMKLINKVFNEGRTINELETENND